MRTSVRAFTLVEILVVCSIICVLTAIGGSSFALAKAKSRATQCLSNEIQLSKAEQLYSVDYGGEFAWSNERQSGYWLEQLEPYGATGVLRCPLHASEIPDGKWASTGYALNQCLVDTPSVDNASRMVMFTEVADVQVIAQGLNSSMLVTHLSQPDKYEFSAEAGALLGRQYLLPHGFGAVRHAGGANYTFVDGHAKWLKAEQFRVPWMWFDCIDPSPSWRLLEWRGPEDGPAFRNLR